MTRYFPITQAFDNDTNEAHHKYVHKVGGKIEDLDIFPNRLREAWFVKEYGYKRRADAQRVIEKQMQWERKQGDWIWYHTVGIVVEIEM